MTDFLLLPWRGLVRRPFYPIATILMLALALAANMAAFGIYYGYDLKPLPYEDADRIVLVQQTTPGVMNLDASSQDYHAVAGLPPVEDAGLWTYVGPVVAAIGGQPVQVRPVLVTPSFFTTLGVIPMIGRLPSASSGQPGGPPEAMISYQFWQQAYGGQMRALGQHVLVNGVSYAVVGVAPKKFAFLDTTDLWASFAPPVSGDTARNADDIMLVRLAPGMSLAMFDQPLASVWHDILTSEPPSDAANDRSTGTHLDAEPLRPMLLGNDAIGPLPLLLQDLALFLLLLAVANTANLALVRNRANLPYFALRRMLGARRLGLLRLLWLEHLPLWFLAGTIGSALGWTSLHILAGFPDIFEAPPFTIEIGWPVYAFGWGLISLAMLVITLVPAWQIAAQGLAAGLGQGTKATLSAAARRAQNALGALQIGLAAALLIASVTLSLSLYRTLTQPRGFDASHRILASVLMPPGEQNVAALQTGVDAVAALPVTIAAGAAIDWSYPFTSGVSRWDLERLGDTGPPKLAYMAPILGDYFGALGISLEVGRNFAPAALRGAGQNQLILDPSLAHALFGDKQKEGGMLDLGFGTAPVIGIAAPVLWQPVPQSGVSGVSYFPAAIMTPIFAYFPFGGATVIAHVNGSDAAAMALIKHSIETALPGALVTKIQPYSDVIFGKLAFRSVIAGLVAGFAALALVLAGFGVYAVNAFIARARLPEFGMRAMLGASPARLLRVALTDAAWLLGIGLAGGGIGGYLLVRAMSSMLFQVDTILPLIFLAAALLIAAIVLLAAWRPAARAASMPVKHLLEAS